MPLYWQNGIEYNSDSIAVSSDAIWDAKGDLAVGTGADTAARLAVGADTLVLTADSTQATGVKWSAVSGGAPSGAAGGDLAGTYPNPTVKASVGLTGVPTAPTAAQGTNTTQLATTAMVHSEAVLLAPIASPTLTGTPAAPTAAVDTNTTQIATTAMVLAQAASATPLIDGTAAVGTSTRFARGDHIHPTDTTRAALAGPTFTGVPAAPTAAVDTNTTQLATTAYVVGQAYAKLAGPTFTGVPAAPTAAVDTNTTQLATTAFVIGQAYAKLASPTFTGTPSLPTGTTGVTQASGNNSTALATTAYSDRVGKTPKLVASPALNMIISTSAAVMTAVLTPTFSVIEPQGLRTYPITQAAVRVTTLVAANTFGIGIYSITFTDATHWTATLVCQLNAAGSTAATGIIKGDVTTGAAGSGAAVATLDFVNNYYIVGSMASEITTGQFTGHTPSTAMTGYGMLRWTAAARTSTTDWPASFTETSSATINASRINVVQLFDATGKILP